MVLLCIVIPDYAQPVILKTDGRITYQEKKSISSKSEIKKEFLQSGTADTLSNQPREFNTLFNAAGQDVLAGWFVCPVDLKIKACGYDCGENSSGVNIELKIVKVSREWTADLLRKSGSEQIGYWRDADSSILPFPNSGINHWIPAAEYTPPFAEDIWSDNGIGAPDKPENDGDRSTYQWIEMNILGYEPQLQKGDIFAVCIKNTEPAGSENTISLLSTNELGYGLMKFYAEGRIPGDAATAGWWQREYILNIAVAVEITGDSPPLIADVEKLETTLSTSERKISATITDENPSGGSAGIQSAVIQYFLNNDSSWTDVPMNDAGDGKFEGIIPGQTSGTTVTYRIRAIDILQNESISDQIYSYIIFKPEQKSLLVFNGFTSGSPDQKPEIKYFGTEESNYEWMHDEWFYGAITEELVNNYDNIIEITNSDDTGNDILFNDKVIRQWISAANNRNYALIGQERLGLPYGFIDQEFEAGTFEYDILGITHLYNDVADTINTGNPSRLFAQQGSLLCNDLFNEFSVTGVDSLNYDPSFETGTANWIDGFDVISDQEVDMFVESRNIGRSPAIKNLACITHRITPSGNKISFIGFDPVAINTSPYSGKYLHFGLSMVSPQTKILQWFNVETTVNNGKKSPSGYQLFQNYPNPFNPSTKIEFTIGKEEWVTLKVYNLLGEESAVLVNGYKKPGSYSVEFSADGLSSGIYYYVLNSAEFRVVRKMVLMK